MSRGDSPFLQEIFPLISSQSVPSAESLSPGELLLPICLKCLFAAHISGPKAAAPLTSSGRVRLSKGSGQVPRADLTADTVLLGHLSGAEKSRFRLKTSKLLNSALQPPRQEGVEQMAWNDRFECMPVEELQKFQFAKLKETVSWLYERIPFYRRKLDESGVRADDLKSVDDITKLPFTEKNDLRDNYPFGLCAVPMNEVVRIHCSSGTTGKPITGPYTAEDVEQWTECVARVLWAATVRKEDIVQVAYGYGLFTGGLGLHQGASRIGCAIVPTSSGMTERQVMLMKDFGATALFCTPSYALTIAERAEEMKMPIRDLPLRVGVFGAEPWTRAMRDEIDERMGISARDIYGLTELGGPGMAYDCDERNGLHINEDHFLAETIDPVTLEPVPPGQRGELVLTAIQRRAMPLLRYRTKDITTFSRQPCSCGRTFVKMDRITGRTDDMLIINGVNVFPSQIEALLSDIKEIELQYLLIVRKKKHLDELNIRVEGKKEVFDAGPGKVAEVERKIVDHIRGMLGIHVGMEMVRPKALKRSEGKAVRVVDERPKN